MMALIVRESKPKKPLFFFLVDERAGKIGNVPELLWAVLARILQWSFSREKLGTRRKEESSNPWLKANLIWSLNCIILVWEWNDEWFSSPLKSRSLSSTNWKQELKARDALHKARCLQSPLLAVNMLVLPGKEQPLRAPAWEQLNLVISVYLDQRRTRSPVV